MSRRFYGSYFCFFFDSSGLSHFSWLKFIFNSSKGISFLCQLLMFIPLTSSTKKNQLLYSLQHSARDEFHIQLVHLLLFVSDMTSSWVVILQSTFQMASTAIHHPAENNKQKCYFRLKKSQNKFYRDEAENSCVYGYVEEKKKHVTTALATTTAEHNFNKSAVNSSNI